ncbi:MAG: transcription elongation factor subunit Spt4 [Candidatus Nanoarchaeia archaeon]|jgi:DNA-directed RNA polymerase subunit E"
MVDKACVKCKAVTDAKTCPVCGNPKLSAKWNGLLMIYDENSDIAKAMELKPGKYALKVKQ